MTGTSSLPGQVLEAAADLGDLLLSVLPGRALHQLQVVDDHQSQSLLALEPAALGADVGDGDDRGIVDVDRRLVHPGGGIDHPLPQRAELARAQLHRVDAADRRQDPLDDLLLRHLEAEQRHRLLLEGDVGGDVHRQGAFSHRRAGGDDHEVGGLEPGQLLVQVPEPGRQPGHFAALLFELLDPLEDFGEQGDRPRSCSATPGARRRSAPTARRGPSPCGSPRRGRRRCW